MPFRPNASAAGIAAAAAAFAAAELLLTLTLGRFLDWDRAEALLFLAWRPWLLVAAAALVGAWQWPRRLVFYALALLLAGASVSLFLMRNGASDPWPEMLRGLAASTLLLIPIDLLIQAGRRWRGGTGMAAAGAAALLLLLVPGVRAPYDIVAIGPGDGAPAARKPRLLLMTSLPIVWGEYGPFDRRSRPSQSFRALQEEFDVQPIDMLDERSLAADRLLLLAQPRWLSPAELTALDAWVRRGGRALILADPVLAWPSALPLGDIRRPVPSSLLRPLLAHWEIELEQPLDPGRVSAWATWVRRPVLRKILMDSPGRFARDRRACRPWLGGYHARCRLGAGRVILVGDADLLRDDLWMAPGDNGGARHRRISDNPIHLADLLDEVAGVRRERVRAPVAWADRDSAGGGALILALLPILLVAAAAFLLAVQRRFKPHVYPQGDKS